MARSFIPNDNVAQTLRFGDGSATGGSRSRWARVELVAVPEPAPPLLVFVAAAALGAARAPRGTAAHARARVDTVPGRLESA